MDKNAPAKSTLQKLRVYIILSAIFVTLLLILPGCQDNQTNVTNPTSGDNNLSAGFYTEGTGDNNQITLTEVKFILRKMTLKYEHGENECDVKLGPFIVNLDLLPKVINASITKIPAGNYDAIKFQVHKPTPNDNIQDPDFVESNNKRYSVVVRGYFNSVPFTYKSSVTVAKKIDFESSPIAVTETPVIYITVAVNPFSWFYENGDFLDPSIESNQHKIDENIKISLRRAFKDMNQDGIPD